MKTALVLGAGGFIGSHLVKRLKKEGYWVKGVDLKYPEFEKTAADEFEIKDLRYSGNCKIAFGFSNLNDSGNMHWDEVYQLAADMGGAGYIFTGEHDADVMYNSASINLNVISLRDHYDKIFYSSSACMYPAHNQTDPNNPMCSEDSAYPANPDSEYGWEKLFSERMYLAFKKNYGLNVKIARFHNIFGPQGSWNNGKEKAPAAICRKVASAESGDIIDIWGDGEQTRSFLFIDECLNGVRKLMESDLTGPYNIGSDEMISINNLVAMASNFENKEIKINHIEGPTGVRGRNSDNTLIGKDLGWKPSTKLIDGLKETYFWIKSQLEAK
jgi:GDP-D-mannose 3', 5'-epimerase